MNNQPLLPPASSPIKTQVLFKPKPKEEVNLQNVENALWLLSAVNRHAFESLIRHCKNQNCSMSFQVKQFIFQTYPILCQRTGQVPADVRKLILEIINNKSEMVNNFIEAEPQRPSPN